MFYGFKLHLICNEKGELLNFMFTPGDVDDKKPLEYGTFVNDIYRGLVGDKDYISKKLFERLFVDGIQLVTKLKNNMKGAMLRKRAIIAFVRKSTDSLSITIHRTLVIYDKGSKKRYIIMLHL